MHCRAIKLTVGNEKLASTENAIKGATKTLTGRRDAAAARVDEAHEQLAIIKTNYKLWDRWVTGVTNFKGLHDSERVARCVLPSSVLL